MTDNRDGTLSVEKSFKTLVKTTPSFEFAEPTVAHNYVLWGVVIDDEDSVGAISKIELLSGNQVVRTESDLSARSFSGLLSDKEYKIRVTYTYDLNDRAGAHTLQKTLSFRTVERPMPSVDVSYNYIKLRSVSFDVAKIDEADIALIENVELYLGEERIAESDSLSVTFDGLEPATEYRIVVTYSFDMGDGYGTRRHYLEFRFKTKFDFGVGEWSQSAGLEINRNGVVTGIGTCEDKVIFIEGATAIGAEAFAYSDIEALYLVDCDRIDMGAFAYCDRLESVIFAGNTSFIGKMAFFECEALERLEFYGGVVEIGESSFERCSALTAVDLPNNLKIIGTSAFEYCSSLKNMTFPDSLVGIGSYALASCAFERIELPEKMNYISSQAFEGCTLLKSIKLPKEIIGWFNDLFRYCSALESVVIPAGEGDFGPMDLAFTGCTSLRSVYIRGNVTRIADGPIEDIHYYFEMGRPPLDFDERWLDADNVTWGYDFSNIE